MSARKPLLYLGIFAALAVFYYFYEYKGGQERSEREDREKKALLFSPDSADTFSLYGLGPDSASVDTIKLAKKDNTWRIVFPIEAEADSEAVARLLDNASGASHNRVVEDSAADLSIFGLDSPQLVFEVSPRPGAELERLALGDKNPGETYIYAASQAEPRRVILLNSWVLSDLKKDVFALRDKKLLKLDKASVGRLVLHKAGDTALELSRADNDWKLVLPQGGLADRDSVNNLLDKITGARAVAFEDRLPAESLTSRDTERPAWTVELYEKESGALHSLELDGKDGQNRYYARRPGMQSVALVDSELVKLFSADPGRLRDRKLVATGRDSILQIALDGAKGAWQLEKDSAGVWSFSRPERARADGGKIDGYLWDITDLLARSFDSRPLEAVSRRLGHPDFTLSVSGSQGAEMLAFLQAEAGDSLFYVKSSRLADLALVDSASAGRLNRAFHDLRLRKVADIETGEVNRVRIEREGAEAIELAESEGKWKITAPVEAEAESWKVQNLLWDIADVEFDSVLSATGSDSAAYGFESPRARLALWKDDSLLAAVSLADSVASGRGVALRASGVERTLAVNGKILEELSLKVEDLEKKN